MNIKASNSSLTGHIQVPGSKSHTIRALIFASLAEGVSHIKNPLLGADCISSSQAMPLIGAKVDTSNEKEWIIEGAGKNAHLPCDVVNVGDSGSLLYFMSPIAATFSGWSIFTGDESIRTRPVLHMVDALEQLGCKAYISRPEKNAPPLLINGPIKNNQTVVTDGALSQYISGIMMAASLLEGVTTIELTNPKEVPFLIMTKKWLEELGVKLEVSEDFKHIKVFGPVEYKAFNKVIPSDWEAVAFPLIAALLTDSNIVIDNVDNSGTQGDKAIVDVLKSVGADIQEDLSNNSLIVKGGKYSSTPFGRLSTENLENNELRVNISGFPDAICALAVISCFIEGTVILEDAAVCRKKETDRIAVLEKQLKELGADISSGEDYLIIHGHSPLLKDGTKNPEFRMHGGTIESFDDHRIAMAFACLGLALKDESIIVKDAECCAVSFPKFYEIMEKINANFKIV